MRTPKPIKGLVRRPILHTEFTYHLVDMIGSVLTQADIVSLSVLTANGVYPEGVASENHRQFFNQIQREIGNADGSDR